MLPSSVRQSLQLAQVVAAAALVRSVAYERWVTVMVASLLIAGAAVAQRGKVWGVGLALASAVAFVGAWGLGMAPAWFLLVGVAGVLPFMVTWPPLARFDRAAATVGATSAAAAGALGAVAWRAVAWSMFRHGDLLAPTWRLTAFSGVTAALTAVGTAVVLRRTAFAPRQPRREQAVGRGLRLDLGRSSLAMPASQEADASTAHADDEAGWDDVEEERLRSAATTAAPVVR